MQRPVRAAAWILAAFALALGGCVSKMARAKYDFQSGQYGDARLALTELEAKSASWDPPERTCYALYRGLTCQAQGDMECARVWLYRAKSGVESAPDNLVAEDRSRLRIALESLGDGPRADP